VVRYNISIKIRALFDFLLTQIVGRSQNNKPLETIYIDILKPFFIDIPIYLIISPIRGIFCLSEKIKLTINKIIIPNYLYCSS